MLEGGRDRKSGGGRRKYRKRVGIERERERGRGIEREREGEGERKRKRGGGEERNGRERERERRDRERREIGREREIVSLALFLSHPTLTSRPPFIPTLSTVELYKGNSDRLPLYHTSEIPRSDQCFDFCEISSEGEPHTVHFQSIYTNTFCTTLSSECVKDTIQWAPRMRVISV